MAVTIKIVSVLIAGILFVIPGTLDAQTSDSSQTPTQDQMSAPGQTQELGMQDQTQDQDISQDQNQDQVSPANGSGSMQQDQSDREPMSELPPKPSPSLRGRPNYGNPNAEYPDSNSGNGSAPTETSDSNGVARVSLIHGDVSTQRGDSGDWSAAQINAPVMAGDKVSTGDKARTELQLDYANILRLAERTQANITTLTRSEIQIQLANGMANYTVLGKSDADAEIDTPNVSIRTERRAASFRILVTADDHTEVLVRRGEVEITTPQGGTRVGENQFITIRGMGEQTQYRMGEAPVRDDWDQWNTDRDRMIGTSVSRRHTNDYYVGSEDLDNNGTWKDVPDYGSVWEPNVGSDWAPYRDGRWVWEPYWGWTWVSYDPWGWAPYHYGRWFEYDGAWAWWPGPVYAYPYYRPIWAPAYVSFFGWGGGFGFDAGFGWGSIGWFPIGPCDYFHPWWGGYRGRFGYTGYYGYNHGGVAPLHGGNRFSNVSAAINDPHFRGASAVTGNQFGKNGGHFRPVNHAVMQNARFTTGNLPVVPGRESLSASGRLAPASTFANRSGNQHFFSARNGSPAASAHSFAREQAQVSNAMRQNGVSPINGSRGMESRNNGFQGRNNNGFQSPNNNAHSSEPGARGAYRSPMNGPRSNTEMRGGFNSGPASRPGNYGGSSPARERGTGNNAGWQKFTPMVPRPPAEPSTGRPSGRAENRGSYGSSRGSLGYPESQSRGPIAQGPESRGYGGSRPPLNMRQPIVTPRSYSGSPYGGRPSGYPGYGGARPAPSYGGGRPSPPSFGGGRPAPSYGGGRSASPSFGGGRAPGFSGGHAAPGGQGGGSSRGGGGSSHGGGSHGGGRH